MHLQKGQPIAMIDVGEHMICEGIFAKRHQKTTPPALVVDELLENDRNKRLDVEDGISLCVKLGNGNPMC